MLFTEGRLRAYERMMQQKPSLGDDPGPPKDCDCKHCLYVDERSGKCSRKKCVVCDE